jgi:hypothetical protein
MVKRFFRLVAGVLSVQSVVLFAQSPVTHVSELMQEFSTTLEELSKSTVLLSDDSYFVNDLFLSIVRQNQAIEVVAKVNPEGTMVNRVTPKGVSGTLKNVADERWFGIVSKTKQPYADLWTETPDKITLFRAWPLIDDSAQPGRLAGVFIVKIDVRELLAMLLQNESVAASARYNNTTVFSHGWREGEAWSEESLWLTSRDQVTLRYQQVVSTASVPGELDVVAVPGPAARKSGEKMPATKTLAATPPAKKKRQAVSGRAQTGISAVTSSIHQTMLTDSFLAAADLPAASSARITGIVVLSILTLIVIAFSLIVVIRRMPKKHEMHAFSSPLSPGPIDALMISGDSAIVADQGADAAEDVSSVERETRLLPALKELIAESSRKLKNMESSTDATLRSRMLREIHENLSLWVSAELSRVTGHLSSLSHSIRECETVDGHTPELQVLRYEIERIIEEIHGVDQRIPNEIFS